MLTVMGTERGAKLSAITGELGTAVVVFEGKRGAVHEGAPTMNASWCKEDGGMRLMVEGIRNARSIELHGERWKVLDGERTIGWFSSLRDAQRMAERAARKDLHFAVW